MLLAPRRRGSNKAAENTNPGQMAFVCLAEAGNIVYLAARLCNSHSFTVSLFVMLFLVVLACLSQQGHISAVTYFNISLKQRITKDLLHGFDMRSEADQRFEKSHRNET